MSIGNVFINKSRPSIRFWRGPNLLPKSRKMFVIHFDFVFGMVQLGGFRVRDGDLIQRSQNTTDNFLHQFATVVKHDAGNKLYFQQNTWENEGLINIEIIAILSYCYIVILLYCYIV